MGVVGGKCSWLCHHNLHYLHSEQSRMSVLSFFVSCWASLLGRPCVLSFPNDQSLLSEEGEWFEGRERLLPQQREDGGERAVNMFADVREAMELRAYGML
jgi:hypothetical protein